MSIWRAGEVVFRIPLDGDLIDFVYFETDLIWRASDYDLPSFFLLLASLDELDQSSRLLLSGAEFTPPDSLGLSGAF